MNLYHQALQAVKDRKPLVAQRPKTGKWVAVDRLMRWPVSADFDSRQEAENAWRHWEAMCLVERASRKRLVSEI